MTTQQAQDTLPNNLDLGDGSGEDENLAATAPEKEKRIRIMLEESDTIPPNGQFFGVQGKGYMLKAGVECDVPASIVDILNSAVMSVPVLDDGQRVIGYKDKLRFPYRVLTTTRLAA
jgi:hypothetical protein